MSPYVVALNSAASELDDASIVLEAFGKAGEQIAVAKKTSHGTLSVGRERTKMYERGRTPDEHFPATFEKMLFLIDWPDPEPGALPARLVRWGKRSGNRYFPLEVVLRALRTRGRRVARLSIVDSFTEP